MKVIFSLEFRKRRSLEFQKTKKYRYSVRFAVKNVRPSDDRRNLGAKCVSCGLEGCFIPKEDLRHDFLKF